MEKTIQDDSLDLKQGFWRPTEQMMLEPKYKTVGSCESIFSQASFQSSGLTILKSSKSQDGITSSLSFSQDRNWSDLENEHENLEIVDDVVGDEVKFKSSWQQLEQKKADGQQNLSKTPHSGHSNSKMSISEFLPEHTKTNDEKLLHFLPEMKTYQREKVQGLVSCEEVSSDNCQATESNGSQKISVSLLKSILMEREFKINDLNKEIRKMQSENLHLLEEMKHLVSDNDRLKRKVEAMTFDKERKRQDLLLSFDKCSPLVLQKEISILKNQINDLQEANESAILELGKADEEISQQRKEFAKLKAEYTQNLEESQEEIKVLTEKLQIGQTSSILSHSENYQEDLQKEITQLRSECRRLRTQSHHLSEENYSLKEDLWDLKLQHECLRERKDGFTLENEWIAKDQVTVPSNKKHLSHGWHTEENSLYRNDAFKVDGTYSKCKAALSPVNIKEPWESKYEERFTLNASPFSMDSENTEVLIMASEDVFRKPAQTHVIGDEIQELSDEDLCSEKQNQDIVLPISPHARNTFGPPVNKLITSKRPYIPVLPRRPFAPKSMADLNLGDLVKFSRPGGKISKGTINYKGHLPGREEIYLGVELEGDELGKHDGKFQGTRYFLCKPNKGVFVNFNKVIMAWN
ncbi:uncharacterized protein LOC143818325 [Ranitomeya variabilis]|uniref:uncharacterized protein LOC143818325 n=1 Tax=Ranitomeya variabilis TaxID=490064 RepID=UPI0040567340